MALNKAVLALSLVMAVFVVGTISTSILQIIAGQQKDTTVVVHADNTPVQVTTASSATAQPPPVIAEEKSEEKSKKEPEKEESEEEPVKVDSEEEPEEEPEEENNDADLRKYGNVQKLHPDYTSAAPSTRIFQDATVGSRHGASLKLITALMSKYRVTPPFTEKVSMKGRTTELPIEKDLGSSFKDVSKPESEMATTTADGIEPYGNTDVVTTWRTFGKERMGATKEITADEIESFGNTAVVTTWQSFGTERMGATEDGTVTEAPIPSDSAAPERTTPDDERAHLEEWIAGLVQRLPGIAANMSLALK